MAVFTDPGNMKFRHAVCSELRVRVEGPRPGNMAKVVLCDEVGTRLTSGILHSWSDKSVAILRDLLESIAQDMVDALEEGSAPGRPEEPPPGDGSNAFDEDEGDGFIDDDDAMNLGYQD
jgi:hypothetical protein